MTGVASLPMYDWPETTAETDGLWALIRDRLRTGGIDAPETLTRGPEAFWPAWESRRLVLSQTCGLPYRSRLHGHVTLVGTPDFGLPDAPPGYYYSQLVVRADDDGRFGDFLGRRLAFNDAGSQSGWAAPQNHAALLGGRFRSVLETGAHRASARAVAEGRTDIAAIDAVTWRLILAHEPHLARLLRVLEHTDPTPGLPMIAAPGLDGVAIADAVARAIADAGPEIRNATGIRAIVAIPPAAYLAVPTPPPPFEADCPN